MRRADRSWACASYCEGSLAFEAPYLIEKLVKDHTSTSTKKKRGRFLRELKRYFYLSRIDQSTIWEMYSLRIDEIWHQFVLFTRQYMDFCTRYYGAYLPHNPSNAPESPKNAPGRTVPVATFEEFNAYYQKTFGEPCRTAGTDDRNVRLNRRVMDARIGRLLLREEDGQAELGVNGRGEVVFAVNSLAAEALSHGRRRGLLRSRTAGRPGRRRESRAGRDARAAPAAAAAGELGCTAGVLSEHWQRRALRHSSSTYLFYIAMHNYLAAAH